VGIQYNNNVKNTQHLLCFKKNQDNRMSSFRKHAWQRFLFSHIIHITYRLLGISILANSLCSIIVGIKLFRCFWFTLSKLMSCWFLIQNEKEVKYGSLKKMLLLNGQKSNTREDSYVKKLISRGYHLYTKSENQKYYLSTLVMLNVSIRQSNLTQIHFVRATKYMRIAIIVSYDM